LVLFLNCSCQIRDLKRRYRNVALLVFAFAKPTPATPAELST